MLMGNFDREMRDAHHALIPYFKGMQALPEQQSQEFDAIRLHLRFVLNHYEFISAGIRRGDIDEHLVLDAERGTILNAYEHSEKFIFAVRNSRRNQALYEHLEWLHNRWEKKPPRWVSTLYERMKGSPIHGKRNDVRD